MTRLMTIFETFKRSWHQRHVTRGPHRSEEDGHGDNTKA